MKKKEHQLDLSWLEAYRSQDPHFGLERMESLLALRGNPHLDCRVIHVAGTNGKGSTIAILSQLLRQAGLRVGVFNSPYLIHYNDQITINGEAISDQDLQNYLDSYQQLLEAEQSSAVFQGLTEFELMTAIAYDYFAHEELDYVIMEVGMGGRLDSTNVCQPVLTAITSIGLDHVALLGPDLASIAREKAGIIKPGIPLLLGDLDPEADQVIEDIANSQQAPMFTYGRDYQVWLGASHLSGQSFIYQSSKRIKASYRVALLGHHQAGNAALAISICDVLFEKEGRELLSRELVDEALGQVVWPGRLEMICQKPLILLDGAHNPHAVAPLIASLQDLFPRQKKTILFTCIRTKALEEMLIQWQELENSRLILTSFEDPRAYSQEEIRAAAKNHQLEEVNWQEFLQNWQAESDELLIVTGSLYFLSQVRPYLLKTEKSN